MWHAEVAIKIICQTQQIISLHYLCKRLIYFLFFFTAFIFQTALSKNWFVFKKKGPKANFLAQISFLGNVQHYITEIAAE